MFPGGESWRESSDSGAELELKVCASKRSGERMLPLIVDCLYSLAHGSESLLASDGVYAIESRFTTADAEGSDAGADVLDDLCLRPWVMREMSYT